ncbi:hypothetical protein Gdia_2680 [Gluconacetobacter diazotrophicus PA1 5]|uniref:Uncharacterized protein n=1 Tax=Gluconacetobacter diazotrophicus TaxID=33996 RepID=A0A7W4I8T1_GLUDI|nr:hypothetical protein [Gluconacetobacter diazotrophicus]ACI52418.1 hypothetical protein Gdia_2680 [Gluconacetobacter diazotrophicus PA1 5]MBB2158363.1 hypothetical protein [Gluconacetobacter diazotrophicus]TWA98073.1 hypothetical protein FBZ86_1672 [Gluconacetobacter diazotrophicus]
MSDAGLSREGLIWKVAMAVAQAEKGITADPNRGRLGGDRTYILALIKEVADTIDATGKPPEPAIESRAE